MVTRRAAAVAVAADRDTNRSQVEMSHTNKTTTTTTTTVSDTKEKSSSFATPPMSLHRGGVSSFPIISRWLRPFALDLRGLAFFRISIGLVVLIDILMRLRLFEQFYTSQGVWPLENHIHEFNGDLVFSLFFASHHDEWQRFVFLFSLIVTILFIIGWRTSIIKWIMYLCVLSIHNRILIGASGGDDLLISCLIWSLFMPLSECWSLDAALRTKSGVSEKPRKEKIDDENQSNNDSNSTCSLSPPPSPPPLHLSMASFAFTLQPCVMYVFSYFLKTGSEWHPDGTALWYSWSGIDYVRPLGIWLRETLPWDAMRYLTYATLILEGFGPILFFAPYGFRPLRLIGLIAFIGFHLGILFTLALGNFQYICCIVLLTLLPEEEWDRVDRWTKGIAEFIKRRTLSSGSMPRVTVLIPTENTDVDAPCSSLSASSRAASSLRFESWQNLSRVFAYLRIAEFQVERQIVTSAPSSSTEKAHTYTDRKNGSTVTGETNSKAHSVLPQPTPIPIASHHMSMSAFTVRVTYLSAPPPVASAAAVASSSSSSPPPPSSSVDSSRRIDESIYFGHNAWMTLLSTFLPFRLLPFVSHHHHHEMRMLSGGGIVSMFLRPVTLLLSVCHRSDYTYEWITFLLPSDSLHSSLHHRRPWRLSHARNFIVSLILTYVLLHNLAGLPAIQESYPAAKAITHGVGGYPAVLFKLDQKWAMFAPSPYTSVSWLVLRGRFSPFSLRPPVDVESMSLFSRPNFDRPTVLSNKYDDVFLFDFIDDMHGKEAHYFPHAAYYCRKWNEKYKDNKEHQLVALDMYFLSVNTTLPHLPQLPVEKEHVWSQDCHHKYVGGDPNTITTTPPASPSAPSTSPLTTPANTTRPQYAREFEYHDDDIDADDEDDEFDEY